MKKNYLHDLEKLLLKFRRLGMKINEVNPITALSCSILEDLYLNNDKKINIAIAPADAPIMGGFIPLKTGKIL